MIAMTLGAAVTIHGLVLHSRKEEQAHSIDLSNVIDLVPINIYKNALDAAQSASSRAMKEPAVTCREGLQPRAHCDTEHTSL